VLPRCLLVIACLAACHSHRAQVPAIGACGAPTAEPADAPRPVPVIAAPERAGGAIFVGERYLAQQTGTSVLVWDLVLGTPTSITRDVELLGIAGDADHFLVLRDQRVVLLEPSGVLGVQVAERPLAHVAAATVTGPARYIGTFHETSIVGMPMWTDKNGVAEFFTLDVGCPNAPMIANPNNEVMATSRSGAIGAVTTTLWNQYCGEIPPRVVTFDLARPQALGHTFLLPPALRNDLPDLLAISDDGGTAVLSGGLVVRLDQGAAQLQTRLETGTREAIESATFVGDRIVASTRQNTFGWAAGMAKPAWQHPGTLARDDIGGGRVVVIAQDQVAVVDAATGKERWHRHRDPDAGGGVTVSRSRTRVVIGPELDGALHVVDADTGRVVRKIGAVPLRQVQELAFTDQGLVASDGAKLTFWSLDDGALSERVPYRADRIGRDPAGHLATVTQPAGGCARVDVWAERKPIAGAPQCDRWPDLESGRAVITNTDADQHTTFQVVSADGKQPVALASVHGGETELELSSDGRRAVARSNGARGAAGDTTSVATWDTATGDLLAEVGPPLTRREQRELFNGRIGGRGFVSAEIEAIAFSPHGQLVAVSRRYTHMDKPNFSYETIQGEAHRVTVMRTDTGERVLPDLEGGTALAFVADDVLVTARGRTVRVFRGKDPIGETTFDGAEVTAIAATADGRVIATAHADGVIRVWTTEGLVLRATLLDYVDDEWLAMTPGGAYVGTAEVGERVSWEYQTPLEPFGFAQFAASLQRPDVVRTRLRTGTGDVEPPRMRPPRVEISSPPSASTAEPTATIAVRVHSATRVDDVRFYVEGKPVAQAAPCGDAEIEVPVPLTPGPNHVTVVAFDDHGLASNPVPLDIVRTSVAARPDLWVVAVGINHYPGLTADAQLGFAVPDARSIADAFRTQAGPGRPYARAHVTLLEDDSASPRAIVHAVDSLRDMKRDDVAIVFLAGHGIKHGATGDMVFLTSGVRAPMGELDDATVTSGSVSWTELGRALEAAPGRVVMLVDACHAGHMEQQLLAPNDDLARKLGSRAGVVVFAASKGRQQSLEPNGARGFGLTKEAASIKVTGGHGLFTAALLASLSDPETDRNGDGAVELSELVDEVTWRVRRASHDLQTPWIVRRELFGDFVLGAR
jgi:hypothetical protein